MIQHRTAILLTALTLGATAAACGQTDTSSDPSTEQPSARESTAVAKPRVVVASDAGVEVVDGQDLEGLGSFDLASRPKLQVAGDDRHVFVLQSDAGKVGVVDAGTWSDAHGDHSHSYVTDPSLLKTTFDRGTSYHAVSDDERSAVWFDDDASFVAFDWKGLEDDDVEVQEVETGTGHHGFAAPTSDGGFLASYAEGEEAAGVVVLDAKGAETARIGGCEGLHGEAHAGEDAYGFGCSDGVLVVDDGKGTKIDAPVEGAGTSTLVGAHGSDLLAANLFSETDEEAGQQVALYDTAAGTSTAIDLGVEFSSLVRDDDQTVALGTDGKLHVIDDERGEVVDTVQVVDPWTLTDDYTDPKPQVDIGGGFAWVTDPRDKSVALFEIDSGQERTSTTLAEIPTSLAVVNSPS